MKLRTIAIAALATGLAAPVLSIAQSPAKPEAKAEMGMTSEQMKKMQAQMDKIRQTQDPEERRKLLAEHQKSMQEAMQSMRGMGGGMMMGGAMGPDHRMQMMEHRMDMMQMMMEQMMQRDQMMQHPGAK